MRKVLIGGEGVLPFMAVQVCATPKGMVFSRFGYKYRIDFGYFGLKKGMVFAL